MAFKGAPGLASASTLMKAWGCEIDPELFVLALTHRSFSHEHGGLPTNERLEFLGDAVLQLVVTEWLYRKYPELSEGELAKMRSASVSQPALAVVARQINLGQFVLLGRGEEKTRGREKDSILCDTLEALIGATYLVHGLEPTRKIVEKQLAPLLKKARLRGKGMDWKTTLHEVVNQLGLENGPVYQVTGTGPDHARVFTAEVIVDEQSWGTGSGSSKKLAEHYAAKEAIVALCHQFQIPVPEGAQDVLDPKFESQVTLSNGNLVGKMEGR